MRRISLFLITNILVMISISLMVHFFGFNRYLSPYGINYQVLAMFSLVWGMAGSIISLFLSKYSAKASYKLNMINPYTTDANERIIYSMVEEIARRAGIKKTPEVGYYHSDEINAFATGWSENHSLVAVSTGLIANMDRPAIEAVIGHEISHIKNGDMVTMTLIQGVVNAFAIFFARVLAFFVSTLLFGQKKDDSYQYRPSIVQSVLIFIFEIALTFLGSIIVFWFSRRREYRADAGGSKLTSKYQMIHALELLAMENNPVIQDKMATMKIDGKNFLTLFSTHPPLSKRIKALKESN